MRVLVVPEYYRPADVTANGTVNDVVAWMQAWLDRDPTVHVYLLAPPETAGYDPAALLGDRERVTLVTAEPPLSDLDRRAPFTENGYSANQLRAIREHVFDAGAYVDVVVDQLRVGRTTLSKWLLDHVDQWAADVRPFDVVANVHDLQVPGKHRYCAYRDEFQFRMEAAAAAFADGAWFTAGVDADRFREIDFLAEEVVEATLAEGVVAGSPVDFDRFEGRYADEPRRLHLAGSLWDKKNADRLLAVAEMLYDRYGIETILTSMDSIPERFRRPDWIESHPEAARETYERALERGDLALCASDYETMARTPFEQAAAGQVLVVRDAPWIRECLPDDYPFAGSLDELAALAAAAVEDWPAAVAAGQRLVAHAREVRGVEACGERTYRDLRRRVETKTDRYGDGNRPEVVASAAADCGERFGLPEVVERTADHTDDGRPLPDHESYARIDLIYTLRALGFEDAGNPGTPVFGRQLG